MHRTHSIGKVPPDTQKPPLLPTSGEKPSNDFPHPSRWYKVRGESYTDLESLVRTAIRQDNVLTILRDSTPYKEESLRLAVAEWFTQLGLPSLYFETSSDGDISRHIASLQSARELARASGRPLDVALQLEEEKSAFFAARSQIVSDAATGRMRRIGEIGSSFTSPANVLERFLEHRYLGGGESLFVGGSTSSSSSSSATTSVSSTSSASAASSTSIKPINLLPGSSSNYLPPTTSLLAMSTSQLSAPSASSSSHHQLSRPNAPLPKSPTFSEPGSDSEPERQMNDGKIGTTLSSSSSSSVVPGTTTTSAATLSGIIGGPRPGDIWRLQCYRSKGVLEDGAHLRLYFLQSPNFVDPRPPKGETRIERLGDTSFLARTPKGLLDTYQTVLRQASERMGPSIYVTRISNDISQGEDSDVFPESAATSGIASGALASSRGGPHTVEGILFLIGHKVGTTHSLFSSLPNVYRYLGLYAVTKYVEIFSNGVVIFTFRLRPLSPSFVAVAAPSVPLTLGLPESLAMMQQEKQQQQQQQQQHSSHHQHSQQHQHVSEHASHLQPLQTQQQQQHQQPSIIAEGVGSNISIVGATPTEEMMLSTAWSPIPEEAAFSHHHVQLSAIPPPLPIPPQETGVTNGNKMSQSSSSSLSSSAHPSTSITSNPLPLPQQSQPLHPQDPASILRNKRLEKLTGKNAPSLEDRMKDLERDASLLFVLPRTSITPLLNQGLLSAQEASYGYAAWKFAYHFIPRMAEETASLSALIRAVPALSSDKANALALVSRLRKVLQSTSWTEAQILDSLFRHPDAVSWCYDDFCRLHKPRMHVGGMAFTPNPVSAVIRQRAASGESGAEEGLGVGGNHHHSVLLPATTPLSHSVSEAFDIDADPSSIVRSRLRARAAASAPIGEESASTFGFGVSSSSSSSNFASHMQQPLPLDEAQSSIRRMLRGYEDDAIIFSWFLVFNRAILRTNFFKGLKTALSFLLDPSFLSLSEYPERPFGIYFVVGAEMRGFHVRFSDVARGGVRLVKSASAQAYAANVSSVFAECYGLALTQSLKNKDIPEGGAKGIVLTSLAHQNKGKVAVQKYFDSILDLLMPSPMYSAAAGGGGIVDRMNKQETLLFFGPDENTADLMDFVCKHARKRMYPYWKAITTGKSCNLGGIPHDEYGMTSRGIRMYEIGIQRVLHMIPPSPSSSSSRSITKVITGGPDGDLGSNEIKLSVQANERILCIIDGSGVLFDPEGLHAPELLRLANARITAEHFTRGFLSAHGFFVSVKDSDLLLPTGIFVPSGLSFRNNGHLLPFLKADFFIPCGGRPAAVSLENVDAFLYGGNADGSDIRAAAGGGGDGSRSSGSSTSSSFTGSRRIRFPNVVEGANLFFTADARLALEQKGVVVVKDASANKGGVTSSSLEVLAALVLTDEEFKQHMSCGIGSSRAAADTAAGSSGSEEEAIRKNQQQLVCASCSSHDASETPTPTPTPTASASSSSSSSSSSARPAFYARYVEDVQHIIEKNAELEFEALWSEHIKPIGGSGGSGGSGEGALRSSSSGSDGTGTGIGINIGGDNSSISAYTKPISTISDQLSSKITSLSTRCEESDALWVNVELREIVLRDALPPSLVNLVGFQTILSRLPVAYQRALFASRLASRFVYSTGLSTDEFSFWEYIDGVIKNGM